jgi:hypothetical protein
VPAGEAHWSVAVGSGFLTAKVFEGLVHCFFATAEPNVIASNIRRLTWKREVGVTVDSTSVRARYT